jgi:hypothetical protein
MLLLLCLALPGGNDPELQDALRAIRSVGREGSGHAEASRAWQLVVGRGPSAYLRLLEAFDGADVRAANWLRTAADAIPAGPEPEAAALEAFLKDIARHPEARFLAYGRLARLDPAAPDRLLPGLLDDPGRDLRREAVARALREAEKGEPGEAGARFARVLPHARDLDQVNAIAARLKKLGVAVDLQAHFGVIARWAVITTFDNTGMKGFAVSYPPEKNVDLAASGEGKGGKPLRVVELSTPDPHGLVDLNAGLGKEMGAVAYAFAVVDSPEEREVDLRVGTNNAVKMFLNRELVAFRDEYHHGMRMDQYVGRGRLRKGRNEVLLKICQNEQKDDWAQKWSFQARLCDRLGTPVPFRNATEVPSR